MRFPHRKDKCHERVINFKKLNRLCEQCTNKSSDTKDPGIEIYTQNVSGAASEIYNINQFLANTQYGIICIQETCFNQVTNVDQCNASTNFAFIRTDRSSSLNKRKRGGGLITFIHNQYDYEEIRMSEKFLIEFQIFRVNIPSGKLYVMNIYMPPYKSRARMVTELDNILRHLLFQYRPKHFVMLGDFNLPNIKWTFDNERPGQLICANEATLRNYETKFLQLRELFGMSQINYTIFE